MMNEMEITSAQYVSYEGTDVAIQATIDGVELSVPLDPANRHYIAIMQAVADGQLTIAEAV